MQLYFRTQALATTKSQTLGIWYRISSESLLMHTTLHAESPYQERRSAEPGLLVHALFCTWNARSDAVVLGLRILLFLQRMGISSTTPG